MTNAPGSGRCYTELFYFIRMRTSPVTGDTADRWDSCPFVIFIEAKIFFVDLSSHAKHMAGDVLFRFGIAGEIEAMRSAVGRRSVAETTLNPQRSFPAVHHFFQIVVTDIFGQYFQISFWLIVCGADCGHSGYHKGKETSDNCNFFVMQHIRDFGSPI
jgi:hypothetical protein